MKEAFIKKIEGDMIDLIGKKSDISYFINKKLGKYILTKEPLYLIELEPEFFGWEGNVEGSIDNIKLKPYKEYWFVNKNNLILKDALTMDTE